MIRRGGVEMSMRNYSTAMKLIGLVLLLWLAQTGDMLTTVAALDRGCVEIGPIMALLSRQGMIAVKVGVVLLVTIWALRERQQSPRMASLMLWLGILAGAGAAIWNWYQLPLC